MEDEGPSAEFTANRPIPPTGEQGNGDLARALTRILGTQGWDGIPSREAIASALAKVLQSQLGEDQGLQSRKAASLLSALIGALSTGTNDGWKLDLKGTKGPKVGFEKRTFVFDLGEFIADQIDSGELFEAAVTEAMARYECGRTKAASAYQSYLKFCSMMDQAEKQILTELRQSLSEGATSPE